MVLKKETSDSIKFSSKSREELLKIISHLQAEKQEISEQNYQQMQQLEQNLNDLRSRFITTVSHEFRTPLTTISFSAGLLENYSHQISDQKKQTHFQRIKEGIEQMTKLLDNVLIVSKLESEHIEIDGTPIDLEKTCRILAEKTQDKTNKHQIIFSYQGANTEAVLDKTLLTQLVSHLLSNAVKYSPEGGKIKFELIHKPQQLILNIQDQGIGIPKSDQDYLFTNFYRGKNIGTISGTGLGLSLVKKIVDLHYGEILIESEENIGTQVQICLPLKTCIEEDKF